MKITACKSAKCSKKCKYFVRYKTRSGQTKAKHFHTYKKANEFLKEQIVLQETGMLTSEQAQKVTLDEFIQTVPLTSGNETTQVVMQQLYDKHIKERNNLREKAAQSLQFPAVFYLLVDERFLAAALFPSP